MKKYFTPELTMDALLMQDVFTASEPTVSDPTAEVDNAFALFSDLII